MKYTSLGGQELLRRRIANECLECGNPLDPKSPDRLSGFIPRLCVPCRGKEESELAAAAALDKRTRTAGKGPR
jgi:hypothetical protein